MRFCFHTVLSGGGEAIKWLGRATRSNVKHDDINVWPASINQLQEPPLPYLGRRAAFLINLPHDQTELAQIKCLLIM